MAKGDGTGGFRWKLYLLFFSLVVDMFSNVQVNEVSFNFVFVLGFLAYVLPLRAVCLSRMPRTPSDAPSAPRCFLPLSLDVCSNTGRYSLCKTTRTSLQFTLVVLNTFLMMILLWNTFAFQNGLIEELLPAMRSYIIMCPLYLLTTILFRGWRAVRRDACMPFCAPFSISVLAAVSLVRRLSHTLFAPSFSMQYHLWLRATPTYLLWHSVDMYYAVHIVHTLMACMYYGVTVRVAMSLCDPVYYVDHRPSSLAKASAAKSSNTQD